MVCGARRQWFDQGGWFDRKDLTFRSIIDLTFVASMGPPGGGKQVVTPRFLRHFNIIGYVEMSDASKAMIFNTILGNFLMVRARRLPEINTHIP
jgi:dynein heavy chain